MVCKGTRKAQRISFFVFVKQGGETEARDERKGYDLRIDSSMIGMESARRYASSTVRTSRFLVKDDSGESAHGTKGMFGNLLNPGTGEELSAESNKKEENAGKNTDNSVAARDSLVELQDRVDSLRSNYISLRSSSGSTVNDFRQVAIRYIFNLLFGGSRMRSLFGEGMTEGLALESETFNLQQSSGKMLTLTAGQYYEECEETSFSTTGTVRTADGREISIHVDVSMSRRFTQYFEEEMQIMPVNTCDPLVINFDGNLAELTDQKFFFDIDGDGEQDEISGLNGSSGYLALDKNQDGIINDGNELFGPKSGNGFADLAAYDEDGNGWIDEGDAIWSKLKIWCRNEDGTDTLYTLADKGVGAICLQNADTDFALKGEANQTKGVIRSTGIFLYENGNVGTIQHLDVAK